MSGLAIGTLGAGIITAERSWAAVEERANRFGIAPGTLVDAQGKTLDRDQSFSDPFIGQIMPVGFGFCLRGWAECAGALLPIAQNTALFSLLGTTFGGDGRTTFGLPDLRGRMMIGQGSGPGLTPRAWGARGGAETVTLGIPQMPSHTHNTQLTTSPFGTPDKLYVLESDARSTADATGGATTATGGGLAHNNMSPFLAIHICIALAGVFPSRN